MINIKRIYEKKSQGDGLRILVDRLWPRGLNKKQAAIDFWFKEIGPSPWLRKWFGHEPKKWPEFKKRYFRELESLETKTGNPLQDLRSKTKKGKITLLYGSKETNFNNAVVLKEYLREIKGSIMK